MKYTTPFLLTLLLGLGFLFNACERNEIVPPNNPPVDTTGTDTTGTDTTSLPSPPPIFDIVLVRIEAGGATSTSMYRRWIADYEIQSTDTVGISYTWRSSVVAYAPAVNHLLSYNQIAEVGYRGSSTDTITVTARRGGHTLVYSKVFVINDVFPTPPPSFDISSIIFYSIPTTRPDGLAWDPMPVGNDTSTMPELRVITSMFRQIDTSSSMPPVQYFLGRKYNAQPYHPTNPYITFGGTPDYNISGLTEVLLLEWDDPVFGHDTIGTFYFIANDYKIPGSNFSEMEYLGPNNLHVKLNLRFNHYP